MTVRLSKLFVVTIALFGFVVTANAATHKETISVVPKSMSGGEDGFSFKATNGKEYYIATNPDYQTKGWNLIDDRKKKNQFCLTLDADDTVKSVARGACKK